jgi:hypothetical protein
MNRFRIGVNEEKIIEAIGLGFIVVAVLTSPNLPRILIPFIKRRGQKEFKKLLKGLEEKRVVYLSGEKIKLTKKGKKLLSEIYLSKFSITKSEKWDGKWRVVSYDVPEIYKKSRNLFRMVLENNDFILLHKSLWASPYDCKEEIAVFAKNLGVQNDVIIMTADKLPDQDDLLRNFNLKSM